MKSRLKTAAALVWSVCMFDALAAGPFLPAVVYSGNKLDGGFMQISAEGAERFRLEFGVRYLENQGSNDAQLPQVLRAVARRGATLVVAVGSPFAPWLPAVAREYPAVKFVLVDAIAQERNIQSVSFREQEAAFLVGMAAALKSQTHTIGFIGGMGLPIIHAFGCGYVQGGRFVDSKVRVLQNMAADSERGFIDPARGVELARSQIDRGADVIFAAAMLTSLGVLQHVSDAGKWSIGVDGNQNYRHPGSVLTSMLKRTDNVVYDAMKSAMQGRWTPGVRSVGLKERAVDWVVDRHNRALITPEMERRINAARDDIIAGKIRVVDFRSNNLCPVK
jgi:basic membrane protein A